MEISKKASAINQDAFIANEKSCIYIMKSIAVFCVVCAHVSPIPEGAGIWNYIAAGYLNYMGTMGVPVFFILSGYLFERNEKSFGEFWKGKVKSVFIPWIFCETLLWLYVVLRKGGITFRSWLFFIIGYQHTTYYLTMLVIMYLVFWRIKKDWELTALILVSVFSIICTGWNFGISFINEWTGTFYLNPLNWICFFAAGMLICRKDCLIYLIGKTEKIVLLLVLTSVAYYAAVERNGGGNRILFPICVIITCCQYIIYFWIGGKSIKNFREYKKLCNIYREDIFFNLFIASIYSRNIG